MKTILISSLLILVFVGCKKEPKSTPKTYFHPPTWIQGEWQLSTVVSGFRFTSDDFITISQFQEQSHKKLLEQQDAQSAGSAKVDETINTTVYNITMTMNGTNIIYKFKLIDATHIEWVNGGAPGNPAGYYIKK